MIKSFFSLLLILLLFLSSIGVTAYRIKDPEFLTEQMRSANLYGRLSETLPKMLDDKMFAESGFTKDDFADILRAAIDGPTFYSFAEAAAGAYLPWLTGETDQLNFQYDVGAVKAGARDRAVDRILAKYSSLPLCNAEQVRTWSVEESFPSCQLPSSNVRSNDVTRLFGERVDELFKPIPNQIAAEATPQLEEARARVSTALRAIQFVWLLTLVAFFLFLAVLRRHAFLSLAFIFLLTGLIEALFGLIAWDWVGKLVLDSMPAGDTGILPVVIDTTTAALDVLKRSLSSLSVGLIIVGAAFLFCWIFFRPKAKHSTVTS